MPDQSLTLEALGWDSGWAERFACVAEKGLEPGRVAVEDKHYYEVITPAGPLISQVTGKLLHHARNPSELPKVGDWVALSRVRDEDKASLHSVLPRRTKLSRKVPGREVQEQVLAANIDLAFMVQALDSTFNPALLQRHLVMVFESGAKPVVVLNKADLCGDVPEKVAQATSAAPQVPIVVVSAKALKGIDDLAQHIRPGETIAFIGSSGVGKSTLINDLCGEEIQATAEVRERDAKGRHTTTWRELILLPNGGLVIDTPGMREFQMWVADERMREAYADLDALALQCHFRNCTHVSETRCAVRNALDTGQLPSERYAAFVKLNKELAFLQQAHTKRAWIDRKRQTRVAQRALQRTRHDPSSD